jgi:hypothetical protein
LDLTNFALTENGLTLQGTPAAFKETSIVWIPEVCNSLLFDEGIHSAVKLSIFFF